MSSVLTHPLPQTSLFFEKRSLEVIQDIADDIVFALLSDNNTSLVEGVLRHFFGQLREELPLFIELALLLIDQNPDIRRNLNILAPDAVQRHFSRLDSWLGSELAKPLIKADKADEISEKQRKVTENYPASLYGLNSILIDDTIKSLSMNDAKHFLDLLNKGDYEEACQSLINLYSVRDFISRMFPKYQEDNIDQNLEDFQRHMLRLKCFLVMNFKEAKGKLADFPTASIMNAENEQFVDNLRQAAARNAQAEQMETQTTADAQRQQRSNVTRTPHRRVLVQPSDAAEAQPTSTNPTASATSTNPTASAASMNASRRLQAELSEAGAFRDAAKAALSQETAHLNRLQAALQTKMGAIRRRDMQKANLEREFSQLEPEDQVEAQTDHTDALAALDAQNERARDEAASIQTQVEQKQQTVEPLQTAYREADAALQDIQGRMPQRRPPC